MTDGPSRPAPNIDGIQYLRAFAALMVVAHHARHYFPEGDQWTTFGSRGVDIFFVISGFIMAHSTASYRAEAGREIQAVQFLLKRVIRVVPLYWLALLWTAKRELGSGGWDLLRDFAFVPHFHRLYPDSIFPVLVPGWTINYEMFFYALFALSLLMGRRRYPFVAAVLVGLAALGAWHWTSAPAIFYTSNVLLEFLFGIGVWVATVRWRPDLPRMAFVLIAVLAAALLAIENDDTVRGFADGPCAAVLVWAALQVLNGVRIDWLRKLGDASYSIYLFHLASFWIPARVLHAAGIEQPAPLAIALVIAVHVATAALAGLLIHRVVEQPLLDALRRRLARVTSPSSPAHP